MSCPSADASNVLQRPTGDSALSAQIAQVVPGSSMVLVPQDTPATASPAASPMRARCVDTSDDEQAVSVLMHGPCGAAAGRPRQGRSPTPSPGNWNGNGSYGWSPNRPTVLG
jgi:hypothetical protein